MPAERAACTASAAAGRSGSWSAASPRTRQLGVHGLVEGRRLGQQTLGDREDAQASACPIVREPLQAGALVFVEQRAGEERLEGTLHDDAS